MTLHPGIASHYQHRDNKAGKIMLDFKYYENGVPLTWHIKMAKANALQKGAGDLIVFFSDTQIAGKRIVVVGDAPEEVRAETERQFDERTKIEWREVFEVNVDDRYDPHDRSTGSGLSIRYRAYQVGTTVAGKPVHRDYTPPYEHLDGTLSKPRLGHIQDIGLCGVTIPYTPANKAALEAICDALDLLGKRVKGLLDQKGIMATLSNVKVLGLPAPKKEKDDR